MKIYIILFIFHFIFTQSFDEQFELENFNLEKPLSTFEISELNLNSLRILRNTIFAKKGREFKSSDLQSFFNSKSWYRNDPNYSEKKLTNIDIVNISIIQAFENEIKKQYVESEIPKMLNLNEFIEDKSFYVEIIISDLNNDKKDDVILVSIDRQSLKSLKAKDLHYFDRITCLIQNNNKLEQISVEQNIFGIPYQEVFISNKKYNYIALLDINNNSNIEISYTTTDFFALEGPSTSYHEINNSTLSNIYNINGNDYGYNTLVDLDSDGQAEILFDSGSYDAYGIIPRLHPGYHGVMVFDGLKYAFSIDLSLKRYFSQLESFKKKFNDKPSKNLYIDILNSYLSISKFKKDNKLEKEIKDFIKKHNPKYEAEFFSTKQVLKDMMNKIKSDY